MQVFANPLTASPFAAPQTADTGSTSSSSNSDDNSATITANDFLQLLVTEMKNQDPTSQTDPNEYINQLVQVNSLEQLISINQDLGGGSSTNSGSGGTTNGSSGVVGAGQAQPAVAAAAGNLSAPAAGGKASRIADALGTAAQTLAPGAASNTLQSAIHSLKSRTEQARTNVSNPVR